jgi:hypothetical protein
MLQMTLNVCYPCLSGGRTDNQPTYPILRTGPFHLQLTTIRLSILLLHRRSLTPNYLITSSFWHIRDRIEHNPLFFRGKMYTQYQLATPLRQ